MYLYLAHCKPVFSGLALGLRFLAPAGRFLARQPQPNLGDLLGAMSSPGATPVGVYGATIDVTAAVWWRERFTKGGMFS